MCVRETHTPYTDTNTQPTRNKFKIESKVFFFTFEKRRGIIFFCFCEKTTSQPLGNVSDIKIAGWLAVSVCVLFVKNWKCKEVVREKESLLATIFMINGFVCVYSFHI